MTRLEFIKESAALCAGASLCGCRVMSGGGREYTVSILGDTHFDASPTELYHGKWVPRGPKDLRDRRHEFRRNSDMWADRLPRLVDAAAKTRRGDTAFLLQLGDLIQGDCTDYGIQTKMLRDAQAACTKGFGDLPFLVVAGNHDLRGGGERPFDDVVDVDFYACDSLSPTQTFTLRTAARG